MPYRIVSPERRRAYYALLISGAVAGFVALGLALSARLADNGHRLTDNATTITVACAQVHRLEVVIHAVLVQSFRTLGVKGGPGYSYYRAHPAELAAARVSLEHEIADFSTRTC